MQERIFGRTIEFISMIVGAKYLGHGRAVESYLGLIALSYGTALLMSPYAQFNSQATIDIAWLGYGHYIGIPLATKGMFTLYGLVANIHGWPYSRLFRFVGALIGSGVWLWFYAKFALLGVPFTFGSFFALFSFLYSIRIMALALADLPRPGVAGAL